MTTALQLLHPEEELNPQSLLTQKLKYYPEKTVHLDGTVTTEYIETNYFLENDNWNVDFFFKIKQFQSQASHYPKNKHKKFSFIVKNEKLKLEFKYLLHYLIFEEKLKISNCFGAEQTDYRKVMLFLNEKHPEIDTILSLDIKMIEKEWIFWLTEKGFKVNYSKKNPLHEEPKIAKTAIVTFLNKVYNLYFNLMDTREEWEKDTWDVRNLNKNYGIPYNKSKSDYSLGFNQIRCVEMKKTLKRYLKQRLLGRNFSVSSAQSYIKKISLFLNFIHDLEPTWNNLNDLTREHIEKYLIYLNSYCESNPNKRNINPAHFICKTIVLLNKFLEDIQRYEYSTAPRILVKALIYPEDKPQLPKKSPDKIDYIPDFVLEQLFEHINDLHPDIIPIIYVAFKTGLRISDTLSLKTNCLVRLNDKYYIETDIKKVALEGHRIPIDNQLADLLAIEIDRSLKISNQDNNPENYIFICYKGRRKGKPYDQRRVTNHLQLLGMKHQIKDENGHLFHFTMHQFRHTYGVKMLNGGADILVVQELLAHASPEMTLTYAKLLDDTKRKAFDEVMKQGVFSFDNGNQIVQYQPGDDIPDDILETLYRDHKLTAMDNPYGTCHARIKGDCPHMNQPPCLTCNSGKPCNHLAIGFSEDDTQKYELLVRTTSKSIKYADQYGREDIKEQIQKNLELYQSILNTLQKGEIIFGNLERLKRR